MWTWYSKSDVLAYLMRAQLMARLAWRELHSGEDCVVGWLGNIKGVRLSLVFFSPGLAIDCYRDRLFHNLVVKMHQKFNPK